MNATAQFCELGVVKSVASLRAVNINITNFHRSPILFLHPTEHFTSPVTHPSSSTHPLILVPHPFCPTTSHHIVSHQSYPPLQPSNRLYHKRLPLTSPSILPSSFFQHLNTSKSKTQQNRTNQKAKGTAL
ncbi:hypothetical protein VTK26DRAFT_4001 [Humicola hyalothermophila]